MDYNQYLTDLYQRELGRAIDPTGLKGWSDALASGQYTPQQVADMVARSNEGVNYDVSNIYKTELGRAADPTGLSGWSQALASGQMNEQQLRDAVRQSTEYGKVATDQYGDQLRKYYGEVLGRDPEAAGLEGWARALRSGQYTIDQIPGLLGGSDEGYVVGLYKDLLGRGMDEAAYGWVRGLQSGQYTRDQVRNMIQQSAEYVGNQNASRDAGNASTPGTAYTAPGVGKVSAFTGYAPMSPLADPRSQTFGFLYDTINQRLGRDVTPKSLLDVDSINAAFRQTPVKTNAVANPSTPVNWAGSAQQQTPASTGRNSGTGSTTNNPNLTSGLLDARNLVSSLYQQELNRAPDDTGMNYWSNAVYNGMTQQQLVDAIRASSEYQGLKSAPAVVDNGYYTQSGPDGGGGNN